VDVRDVHPHASVTRERWSCSTARRPAVDDGQAPACAPTSTSASPTANPLFRALGMNGDSLAAARWRG